VEGEKEYDGDNEDDDKEEQEEAEEGEEEEAKAIRAEEEDMAALTTAAHSPSFKGWIDRTTTSTTQVASSLPQSTWCRAFFFSPISVHYISPELTNCSAIEELVESRLLPARLGS
jgi:hypothetical protein